jgi:hypothetical protein
MWTPDASRGPPEAAHSSTRYFPASGRLGFNIQRRMVTTDDVVPYASCPRGRTFGPNRHSSLYPHPVTDYFGRLNTEESIDAPSLLAISSMLIEEPLWRASPSATWTTP